MQSDKKENTWRWCKIRGYMVTKTVCGKFKNKKCSGSLKCPMAVAGIWDRPVRPTKYVKKVSRGRIG